MNRNNSNNINFLLRENIDSNDRVNLLNRYNKKFHILSILIITFIITNVLFIYFTNSIPNHEIPKKKFIENEGNSKLN